MWLHSGVVLKSPLGTAGGFNHLCDIDIICFPFFAAALSLCQPRCLQGLWEVPMLAPQENLAGPHPPLASLWHLRMISLHHRPAPNVSPEAFSEGLLIILHQGLMISCVTEWRFQLNTTVPKGPGLMVEFSIAQSRSSAKSLLTDLCTPSFDGQVLSAPLLAFKHTQACLHKVCSTGFFLLHPYQVHSWIAKSANRNVA